MTVERVLVIPRAAVPGGTDWTGLRRSSVDAVLAVAAEHGSFMDRDAAEVDPAWKQLIPYLVLRDGDRTFLMRRTRAGSDARLHDRYSIGIGGHVETADADIAGALQREWREEIDAGFDPEPTAIGLLNDDTTAVGAVHLGIVFVAEAGGRDVRIRETDKLVGAFASPEEVLAVVDAMESWSQLIVDELVGSGASATPGPAR